MEKIIVCAWQIWSCYLRGSYWQYLVAFRQDTRNVHYYVACSTPKCDFGEENAAE
jgi:hypothetical protein